MKEVVVSNQKYLLICLRYEFLREKPVFETYKSLCKTLGYDAIEYKDFEFWYYRFSNGNFDLNYDRSLDPPTPYLSDMPENIIDKIIGKLEWKDRSIFRKTSKKYRELIDCRPQNYNKISLHIHVLKVTLSFDDAEIEYSYQRGNICLVNFISKKKESQNKFTDKQIKGRYLLNLGNYVKIALKDLMIVLKNPEVHVENFIVSVGNVHGRSVGSAFKSLNHQINVKCFEMNLELESGEEFDYDEHYDSDGENEEVWDHEFGLEDDEPENERVAKQGKVMRVLPYLKPNTLETIELNSGFKNERHSKMKIDEIVELEQWKKAKVLRMPRLLVSIPVHHYFNFNTVDARIYTISSEDVLHLRDAYLNLPNFNYCEFELKEHYGRDGVKQALGSSSFQSIDSNDKLEVRADYGSIRFKRSH